MGRNALQEVSFAPLCVHRFPLVQPHTLLEAEKFNLLYHDFSQLETTADKLRWHRYQRGLLQREVADYLGISPSTYMQYEAVGRDSYPIAHIERLVELYNIPVESLLDEYNLFLYHGQGHQIREKRKARKMTQAAYAKRLGVTLKNLERWERDRVQMCKSNWQIFVQKG